MNTREHQHKHERSRSVLDEPRYMAGLPSEVRSSVEQARADNTAHSYGVPERTR